MFREKNISNLLISNLKVKYGIFGIFPKKSYNFSTNRYYIDIKTDLESLHNFEEGVVLVF